MIEFRNTNLGNKEPDHFYRVFEFVTDWVINGGGSGHHKRPFDTDLARPLGDDCKAKAVPFFFKQIDKVLDMPTDLMVREFPNYSLEQIAA